MFGHARGLRFLAQVGEGLDLAAVRQTLAEHPATRQYLFHVLVWPDVPMDDARLMLWGWFTRFGPLADLHPARREPAGNRMLLHPPILIDATWKPGYRRPVAFDEARARQVDARWGQYGIGV
jgi:hypothetical protein